MRNASKNEVGAGEVSGVKYGWEGGELQCKERRLNCREIYGFNPGICKCLTMKTVLHFEGKKIGAEEMSRSPSATKRNEETREERKRTGEGNYVIHAPISRERNVSYIGLYTK